MQLLGSQHETDGGYDPRQYRELAHGSVPVDGGRDPVPYTVSAPYDLMMDSTGMIVPGLGAFKRTSRAMRDQLTVDEGMAVISYDPLRAHARAENSVHNLSDPQELHYRTIERILEDVSINKRVHDLPNGREIADQLITFMPHSMGVLPTAEFASTYHCEVKQIIYLGGVGLQDPQGLKIIGRGVKEIALDIAPKIAQGRFGYSPSLAQKSLKYFLTNPPRVLAEIASCAQGDVRQQVMRLRDIGIPQSIVCFENDIFFPPDETKEGVGYIIGQENVHVMEGADHVEPQSNPVGTSRFIGTLLLPNSVTSAAVA